MADTRTDPGGRTALLAEANARKYALSSSDLAPGTMLAAQVEWANNAADATGAALTGARLKFTAFDLEESTADSATPARSASAAAIAATEAAPCSSAEPTASSSSWSKRCASRHRWPTPAMSPPT